MNYCEITMVINNLPNPQLQSTVSNFFYYLSYGLQTLSAAQLFQSQKQNHGEDLFKKVGIKKITLQNCFRMFFRR